MASVSKTFNELVAFTRSTSATYVNSAGYITTTPVTNYLTYSNQFENAAWTKSSSFVQTNLAINSQDFDLWSLGAGVTVAPNTTIAPDGTLTADRITFTAGGPLEFVRRSATLTVGVVYTASVYAQIASGTPTFIFDAGNAIPSTAQTPTSAWQRFTFTFTFSGVNQWVDLEASGAGTIAFWGFQLVQGAVPGDYRATTTAALPILYPDYTGALRARKLCETTAVTTQHVMFQQAAVGTATQYTTTIKVKAGERTAVRFINYDGTTNFAFMYVNLATGAIQSSGANGTASNATFSVTSLGSGWYLLTITCDIPSPNRQSYLNLSNPIGTTDYTGDGSSGVYVADAQINPGAVAGPYYDTGSTITYAQRRDFSPSTLACLGLLIEEQRTNLATYSNTFSDASWAASIGAKIVAVSGFNSPEGVANAWTLTDSSAIQFDGIQKAVTVAADATTYTASVFIRKTFGGTSSTFGVNLGISGGTAVTTQPRLNTDTGTLVNGVGVVTNAGDYWRLSCSVTNNSSVGNTTLTFALYPATAAYNSGADVVTATGSATIYQAQLEAGAFATSPIPTTASQVTRAADIANVNVLSPWFNQPGGTLYCEADTFESSVLGVRNAAAINDGTSTNMHRVLSYTGKIGGNTIVASVTSADLQPYTYTVNTPFKFAYAYATNDFAAVGNGGAPSTDPLGTLPTSLTVMGVGNLSGVFWCGHIRRITYYPQRLTNAQLQSITT